jgi:uncharacterized protein
LQSHILCPMHRSPLELVLTGYDSLLIGFSGGVDSALLTVVARKVLGKDRTVAAVGTSPSLPSAQLEQARQIASQFDLNIHEIRTDELDDPHYVANTTQRCYYCKRELWTKLVEAAKELGMSAVAEGTNADDLGEHRPGLAAANEFGIVKPLAEAGYTKDMVREEARKLGIPIWDAPAAPCLSSRLLYELPVTPERLSQVEDGEAFLRRLGVDGDLRVRHRGSEARIEVANSEFDKIREAKAAISDEFTKLGFAQVTLDLSGYQRGSLLKQTTPELERLS